MTNKTQNINLLKNEYSVPESLVASQAKAKKYSIVFMGISLVVGIICFILFLITNANYQSLLAEKSKYNRQLESHKEKEMLFLSIKDRIVFTKSIKDSLLPLEKVVDLVLSIADPSMIQSFNYTDKQAVVLAFRLGSLENAHDIVAKIMDKSDSNQLSNPFLDTINISETGINLSVNFIPKLLYEKFE